MNATLLLGLAVAIGAPIKDKDVPKELSIVGEWVGEKAEFGGMNLPVPDGGINFSFTADGKMTIREGTRPTPDAGSYTIDTKKNPAEIDLIPAPGKKEPTVQAIVKVDGDTMTLCFARGPGGTTTRPAKFESPAGSQTVVITLKRVKK
jgi:uncharacterized protein (TIGR03067 family)